MSNFIGNIGKEISIYAVIKETNRFYKSFIYTILDDECNIVILETDKKIDCADGKHYFLVEATVKEHREVRHEKQTVIIDCDWELIGKMNEIKGAFCCFSGDELEFNNITANFRRVYDTEWISNGELTVVAPASEYRLIFEYDCHKFILPFDSLKKLTYKDSGKFNITAKIIGYRIENGVRATFLYPRVIEDKNGTFYASKARTYGLRR